MRLAVTGGCGYLGSVLVPKLGPLVTQLDILDPQSPRPELNQAIARFPHIRHIALDVADAEKFQPLANQYDFIIHLAGLVGYPACDKNPDLAVRCNVETTRVVLKHKRPDTGVLYSSTCSNYGDQSGEVDENTAVHPTSWHGKTKVEAEKLVLKGKENIVYRFVSAFGRSPHTRDDLLIHDFVRQALSKKSLSVYESHYIRQFVHIGDITDAMVFSLSHWKQMQGQVFNVGNPNIQLTKQDLVKEIAKQIDFQFQFENSGSDLEKRNYPVIFEKILKVGFVPKVSLSEGITELVTYYREARARSVPSPKHPSLSP